ncbi:MAG: SDR family oxidoreductase [Bdellovibrionota bacterium]
MNVDLKKLSDQVIVITGASSGIGLATAEMAADQGAKVVLVARNEEELKRLARRLKKEGKEVEYAVGDVADEHAMEKVAEKAINRFGRIDTWVNNAAVSIYGRLTKTSMKEKRRLFDVNFWGVVNGCRAALPHLQKQGGALINIGSILSERAIPLQGAYVASKHAVKGYTDSLRMELESEEAPISVTLVMPGAIDTPYTEHARNHLNESSSQKNRQPVHTPPVYAPEVVAKAILECAQKPVRNVYVGGSAKFYSLLEKFAPRAVDLYMEKKMLEEGQSRTDLLKSRSRDSLFRPSKDGDVHGRYPGHVLKSSIFTTASLHPVAAVVVAGGVTTLASMFLRKRRKIAA